MNLTFVKKEELKKLVIQNQGGMRFEFLENGSVFSIMRGDLLINQVLGNPLEGSMNNLYLRIWKGAKAVHFPIMGPSSGSAFAVGENDASWSGTSHGVRYACRLLLDLKENIWFWDLTVENLADQPITIDSIFTQDLGLASLFGVRLNEAYTSQYVDHKAFKDDQYGYCICSRQSQAHGKEFPWIMHGCLTRAEGYLTDGFQFYGLSYKETNVPEALAWPRLPNKNWQYEFAYPTLQSKRIRLRPRGEKRFIFFALLETNHPAATSSKDISRIHKAAQAYQRVKIQPLATTVFSPATLFDHARCFQVRNLTAAEVAKYFGKNLRHIEHRQGKLQSFFYGDHVHVALKAKELNVERPHGHILRTGTDLVPSEEIMSTTSHIYGVFNSQITLGNTSFNKLLSVSRNHLNVLKTSGQRIFIKTVRGYELLGIPSAYETGLNHARWIYRGREETVIVSVWTSLTDPVIYMTLEVEGGKQAEFLFVQNIVLGNNEWDSQGKAVIDTRAKTVTFTPAKNEMVAQRYPETSFSLVTPEAAKVETITGDALLFADGQERHLPYVSLKTKKVRSFTLAFTGNILSRSKADKLAQQCQKRVERLASVQADGMRFWETLANRGTLHLKGTEEGVSKLNDLLYCYLHNAMVHYTTPHGLEQYSGAAWGLRDVCQGPVEFLMATRNLKPLRKVLCIVFSHQYARTGDWPQWFMFDRYQEVQSHESHADIIVWPLKALCDYIETTNDFTILREKVAYTDDKTFLFTNRQENILQHADKQIAKMEKDCIPGTALASYGHGDWEDTLQPADPSMRARLVSAWTVELMFQTLRRYQRVCQRAGEAKRAQRAAAFADRIQADFNRHLVRDGVVAGLAHFGKNRVEYILHPSDKKTGIQYRLLPMTRGMIAGIFAPAQMKKHLSIIYKHLYFPDGVRLMNRPMEYRGGVERYFKRAETAANFGREIGLQYVHSHIRFIEAMAKLGKVDEVYRALLMITPITLSKSVSSAAPRQASAYFSSSDAAFLDRYEALRDFDKIKSLKIPVKGGWRIYSSGPGIFINQLISGLLGIRVLFDKVLLDPVLSKKLNGLVFDFDFEGQQVRYVYHVKERGFSPTRVMVNGQAVNGLEIDENPYRRGGVLIDKAKFKKMLNQKNNRVDIHV